MAVQPTAPTDQPPPDLPNMPDVSDTLSGYLRRFSVWCRNGFHDKVSISSAQPRVLLQETVTTNVTPRIYALTIVVTGSTPAVVLTQVALGGQNPGP